MSYHNIWESWSADVLWWLYFGLFDPIWQEHPFHHEGVYAVYIVGPYADFSQFGLQYNPCTMTFFSYPFISPPFNWKRWAITIKVRHCRRKNLLVGTITLKVFYVSFLNLLCIHVTYDRFSGKFNNSWKNQNGLFIAIFRILHQWFDLVGAITSRNFMYPAQICYACY